MGLPLARAVAVAEAVVVDLVVAAEVVVAVVVAAAVDVGVAVVAVGVAASHCKCCCLVVWRVEFLVSIGMDGVLVVMGPVWECLKHSIAVDRANRVECSTDNVQAWKYPPVRTMLPAAVIYVGLDVAAVKVVGTD